MPDTQTPPLSSLIQAQHDEITRIRRDLHAHPEILFTEERTSKVVQEELGKLGIVHKTHMGGREPNTGFGVVAHIPATVDNPGDCIGLRADMDALPIEEASEIAHKSTVPGKMHACGHDGHTSILIGVARVLMQLEHRPNPVTLVFQPAEEGGGGGDKMCRDGALDGDEANGFGPPVKRMYGLHGWPDLPLGTVSTRKGPLLAATDTFDITIKGVQGHAAYPHLCVDPVVASAHIITMAQSIASRTTRPTDSVVVTFGSVHAGSAYNVIPETCTLKGTIRTLDMDTRSTTKERFFEIVELGARAMGCVATVQWNDGYPVTRNDEHEADRIAQIAAEAELANDFQWFPEPGMGGEDFSYYALKVPSCFYLIGLSEPARDPYPGLHTPGFDFNDKAIPVGMEMMCRLALS
ncbi:MAG: amidohydrolase [Phycisphaerales bacterium]|nr:amidohydrolase [Phycisphaerales bacterium]